MKTLNLLTYIFALIGLGMLAGAFYLYQNTSEFLASATRVDGTVIDLVASRSSDSTTYKPVVVFTTQAGEKIEITSTSSSNPPAYTKGERVDVFYNPGAPHEAKISGYFSLWGGATIVGGLGSVFFFIGGGMLLAGVLHTRKTEYLKTRGVRILTTFQGVELNRSITVNGRHPFRVLCQWQHPLTSDIHVFTSDNLWYDPTAHIKATNITVFIENDNPKKYFVDLSFLPKLAS